MWLKYLAYNILLLNTCSKQLFQSCICLKMSRSWPLSSTVTIQLVFFLRPLSCLIVSPCLFTSAMPATLVVFDVGSGAQYVSLSFSTVYTSFSHVSTLLRLFNAGFGRTAPFSLVYLACPSQKTTVKSHGRFLWSQTALPIHYCYVNFLYDSVV
jgi:hypothetical protein